MPIHDWTRVTAGTFHDFHTAWIVALRGKLNGGLLPAGYYALAEQVAGNTVPDVLTLQDSADFGAGTHSRSLYGEGGVAVAAAPPKTSIHEILDEARVLATKRRRIVIRHATGDRIVALLEIVSSGNKSSSDAVDQFVETAAAALNTGFHLLVLDLFAPGSFDPEGIHGRLWGSLGGHHIQPEGTPLTLASYAAGGADALTECYVEPTAVGQTLFAMPLFLSTARYVNVPLEETYLAAYAGMPARWKRVIEDGPRG